MLGGTLENWTGFFPCCKISKKYKLITVFNDFSAFESLNNYELFSLWKINYSFYIQPKNKIYLRFLKNVSFY